MLEMSELGGNPERSNRIVEPEYNESDTDIEYSLRPKVLDEYIGQDKVKENMKVYIEAAKSAASVLTTCCSTVLPDLVRPRFRVLSRTRWA